jgi:23S rRNA (pseudouridine1915-N3)-methyltransferase
MRIAIASIGRLKAGPERELVARYADRFEAVGRGIALGPLSILEAAESQARRDADRRGEEAAALRAARPDGALAVALDERGADLDSAAFAAMLREARDGGRRDVAFVIGGPDGLDPAMRSACARVIRFGAMTLPHQLARVVLCEQLYRAATLIAGHPYHRA